MKKEKVRLCLNRGRVFFFHFWDFLLLGNVAPYHHSFLFHFNLQSPSPLPSVSLHVNKNHPLHFSVITIYILNSPYASLHLYLRTHHSSTPYSLRRACILRQHETHATNHTTLFSRRRPPPLTTTTAEKRSKRDAISGDFGSFFYMRCFFPFDVYLLLFLFWLRD